MSAEQTIQTMRKRTPAEKHSARPIIMRLQFEASVSSTKHVFLVTQQEYYGA